MQRMRVFEIFKYLCIYKQFCSARQSMPAKGSSVDSEERRGRFRVFVALFVVGC